MRIGSRQGRAGFLVRIVPLLLLGIGVLPLDSAAEVTLEQSVFQENFFATDLFHSFGSDDFAPEHFEAANDVGYVSGSGYVRTLGGALPRAEGGITFTAHGVVTTSLYSSFSARVYYEWAVVQVGGDPFVGSVPIDVHTRGAVELSTNDGASPHNLWAQTTIGKPYGLQVYRLAKACVASDCTLGPLSFDEALVWDALPDTRYFVTLTALGSGYLGSNNATFTMSAWVDPRIEISPSFARRDDFRLIFSAGVTPVPEPESYAMLLAGLGLLGFVARRRKKIGLYQIWLFVEFSGIEHGRA